jgi:hypothetical protein
VEGERAVPQPEHESTLVCGGPRCHLNQPRLLRRVHDQSNHRAPRSPGLVVTRSSSLATQSAKSALLSRPLAGRQPSGFSRPLLAPARVLLRATRANTPWTRRA